MLAAVGQLDRLVACTKYRPDLCPDLARRNLTIVPDSWTANKDSILSVRPALVIAAAPDQDRAVVGAGSIASPWVP